MKSLPKSIHKRKKWARAGEHGPDHKGFHKGKEVMLSLRDPSRYCAKAKSANIIP